MGSLATKDLESSLNERNYALCICAVVKIGLRCGTVRKRVSVTLRKAKHFYIAHSFSECRTGMFYWDNIQNRFVDGNFSSKLELMAVLCTLCLSCRTKVYSKSEL